MSHFLVQVHVIQALNLIPTSDTNTAIPVCEVECWGERKQSKKGKDKTLNPFWDKNFNFEREGVDLSSGENTLKITVYDTDTWFTNDVIGEYVIDLAHVYNEEPNHELYRKWIVLSKDDEGDTLGFLKASVLVLNISQGDTQPPRDEEDPFADPATDNADDLEGAMLKPPNLRKDGYLIHCEIWEAQDLPIMDIWGTIDPFVRVGFAGKKKIETQCFPKDQNPKFKTQVTLKVGARAPTDIIILELLDRDVLFDELVSNKAFSFKKLLEEGNELPPRWFPLYGHAEEPDLSEVLKACYKKQMNEPQRTRYVGRLLVGFKAEYMQVAKPPSNPITQLSGGVLRPRECSWTLRFDLYQGASLDDVPGWFDDLVVEIEWGTEIRTSGYMYKDEHGIACWFEQFPEIITKWPEVVDHGDFPSQGNQPKYSKIKDSELDWGDWDQIPFVVIRLVRDGPVSREAVSERLVHPKDIPVSSEEVASSTNSNYKPQWWIFNPVRKKSGKLAIDIPTFLQFRIGLNSDSDPAGVREKMIPAEKKAYVLRSHIYQARGLAAADRTGTSDPYCEIQCGNYRKTTRRNEETLCPIWYETLTGRIFMPAKAQELSQAPMINITVWDWEQGLLGFSADVIIGRSSNEVSQKLIVCQWKAYEPRKPHWRPLYDIIDGKKVPAGELLVSFDILHPNLAKEIHHKLPEGGSLLPWVKTTPMFLEYNILGLRELESLPGLFSHNPVSGTSIRIKCGTAEWEDVVDYEWINNHKSSIYLDDDLLGKKQKYLSLPMMQTPLLEGEDSPNGWNPHYGFVGYLKFNYPVDKRYTPNIVVEVRDKKGNLIGIFDESLETIMAEQGTKRSGTKDEHMKLALERNGIDPSSAIDRPVKSDGKEADIEAPEEEDDNDDDDMTDDDEELAKRAVSKNAPDRDNISTSSADESDRQTPDHEPLFGYDGPYENELKHLPYNRYLLKRQAPVAFNPFSLSFDRTPKLITCGVFKGRFRLLKPMEVPGHEFNQILTSNWGTVRGEPGDLTHLSQYGSPEQILDWSSDRYLVVDHIRNRFRNMSKSPSDRPLFYIGVDHRESGQDDNNDNDIESTCSDDSSQGSVSYQSSKTDEEDLFIDDTQYDRVPTTSADRGGEVLQWFWDRQQEEWENKFSPRELVVRIYVYNSYYLVGSRGNNTNPTLHLSVPQGNDIKSEQYPSPGCGSTAWPMVLRTLSPNFRHTFDDVTIYLPGAGVSTLSVLDRDEGIFTTSQTQIGFTKFDLEDLAYDGYFTDWRSHWDYNTWPTEQRSLSSMTSKAPMGKVKMFVQVLDPDVAQKNPPMSIKGPGPMDFEVRLTIMGLREIKPPPGHEGDEVPRSVFFGFLGSIPCCPWARGPLPDSPYGIMCCPGGLNIMVAATAKWSFPECEEDNAPYKETDTRKCVSFDDMSAEYNWRMSLPVTLPCKFHFIQINVYSTRFFGLFAPDAISENVFNLKAFFDRALDAKGRKPITVQLPADRGGKWINLTHPKTGEETMAQLSVHMEIVSKELVAEQEDDGCLEGEDAWGQVTTWPTRKLSDLSEAQRSSKKVISISKPNRPPTDFWPFNVLAWGRWCMYRHYWKIVVGAIIGVIIFVIGVVIYMKMKP